MFRLSLAYCLFFIALPFSLRGQNSLQETALFPFASGQEAAADRKNSRNHLDISGIWKSFTLPSKDRIPAGFEQPDYPGRLWEDARLPVSASGQQSGPASAEPAVFLYRKKVRIPADWKGKAVFISFGSGSSAIQFWLNGHSVCRLDEAGGEAVFNLSKLIQDGENTLALQVRQPAQRPCLSRYAPLAGMDRDAFLFAAPNIRIQDMELRAGLENGFRDGRLEVDIRAFNGSRQDQQLVLKASLTAEGSGSLWTSSRNFQVRAGQAVALTGFFNAAIPGVPVWSAEAPRLCTLLLQLETAQGKVLEVIRQETGFRQAEIRDGLFLLNGQAVKFRGINLCGHSGTGNAEAMKEAIRRIKMLNINAVKTDCSLWPSGWFELCNRHGLYVLDALPAESSPRTRDGWQNRGENYKNQTCVVARYFAGTPDGKTELAITRLRNRDKTRPCLTLYGTTGKNPAEVCRPYPMPGDLDELAKTCHTGPFLLNEYPFPPAQPCGQWTDYWSRIRINKQLQGGFFGSTCLGDANGRRTGQEENQDRDETLFRTGSIPDPESGCAAALGLRQSYSPVQARITMLKDKFEVSLQNQQDFLGTSYLKARISLWSNGRMFGSNELNLNEIKPGGTSKYSFLYPDRFLNPLAGQPLQNRGVEIEIFHPAGTGLLPPGCSVFRKMTEGKGNPKVWQAKGLDRDLPASITENDTAWVMADGEPAWQISKKTGLISVLREGRLTEAGPGPAVVVPDTLKWNPSAQPASGRNLLTSASLSTKVMFRKAGGSEPWFEIERSAPHTGSPGIKLSTRIYLTGKRTFVVRHLLEAGDSLQPLIRLGDEWQLPPSFDSLECYGRGPQNTFSGHDSSACAQNFKVRISVPVPTCSTEAAGRNHVEVKYLRVYDAADKGMAFSSTGQELSCGLAAAAQTGLKGAAPHRLHVDFRQSDLSIPAYSKYCLSDTYLVLPARSEWSYRVELK